MGSPSDNQTPQTSEEFAQRLRTRAKEAAAASVQYASLSGQYLELSERFAALAEKATATATSELQDALKTIEPSTARSQDSALPAEKNATSASRFPDASALRPPPFFSASSPQFDLPTDNDDGAESIPSQPQDANPLTRCDNKNQPRNVQSKKRSHSHRRDHSNRIKTRTLVQRFRSVKLAIAKRVRIKANKEDLKPPQRTPLEELNKSRSSIASSLAVIVFALFMLSLITLQFDGDIPGTPIIASFADAITDIDEPLPVEIPKEVSGKQQEEETAEPVEELEAAEDEVEESTAEREPEMVAEESKAPVAEVEESKIAGANEDESGMAAINNRSTEGRQQMLEKFGGSAATESAVQRSLEWLVSIQHRDGWWDFPNVGDAGNPGKMNNPIGGTAYALLPFLAAGHSHREGSYKRQVKAGLDYLTRIGFSAPAGYDLRGVLNKGDSDKEPNEAYYVHGAATLVLCEAYGMTRDRRLKKAAEGAISFLLNSQDPVGGGWRYLPQQPGSTSVTAIQVMALVAAQKAKLKVPKRTLDRVKHYLDSVQVDGEGRYAYRAEKKTFTGSATAMALLCRMYLGWGRGDGDMRDGVAILDKAGPYDNLYTTYFATQVMRNWGGDKWTRWNEQMRQLLVDTQVSEGPGKGSWKPRTGQHKEQGGRLLETSLATLTLEVYYRYKPILPDETAAGQHVAAE